MNRYGTPRSSPAQSVTSPTSTTTSSTPGGYTSRFVNNDHDIHDYLGSKSSNPLGHDDSSRAVSSGRDDKNDDDHDEDDDSSTNSDRIASDANDNNDAGSSSSSSLSSSSASNRVQDDDDDINDDRPDVVVVVVVVPSHDNNDDTDANENNDNNVNDNDNQSAARLTLLQSTEISEKLAGVRAPLRRLDDNGMITNDSTSTYDNDNNDNRNSTKSSPKIFVEGKQWTSQEDGNNATAIGETTIPDHDDENDATRNEDDRERNNHQSHSSEGTSESTNLSKTEDDDSESVASDDDILPDKKIERFETESKTAEANVPVKLQDDDEDDEDEDEDDDDDADENDENEGESAVVKQNGWANGHVETESEEDSEEDEEEEEEEETGTKNEVTDGNSKHSFIDDNVPIKYQTLEEEENLFDDNGWVVTDESLISATQKPREKGWPAKPINSEINNNNKVTGQKEGQWSIGENGWVVVSDDENDKGIIISRNGEQQQQQAATANLENVDGALVTTVMSSAPLKRDSLEDSAYDTSLPMQMVTTVFCVSVLCCSVLINLFM